MSSKIQGELEALRDTHGVIHPRRVLDWAKRHPKSLLHKKLEWNDSKAGNKYRLAQIRQLIEIHATDPLGGREYVSLSIDRVAGGGYRPTGQVMATPQLREVLLQDAISDLERLERLYRFLPELAGIWRTVASLRASRGRKDAA